MEPELRSTHSEVVPTSGGNNGEKSRGVAPLKESLKEGRAQSNEVVKRDSLMSY